MADQKCAAGESVVGVKDGALVCAVVAGATAPPADVRTATFTIAQIPNNGGLNCSVTVYVTGFAPGNYVVNLTLYQGNAIVGQGAAGGGLTVGADGTGHALAINASNNLYAVSAAIDGLNIPKTAVVC